MSFLRYQAILEGRSREYALELACDEVTIGRESDNVIVVAGDQVSRHHARIVPTADGFLLLDNNTAGGTWVNQTRVRQHILQEGDSFQIGSVLFSYGRAGLLLNLALLTMTFAGALRVNTSRFHR